MIGRPDLTWHEITRALLIQLVKTRFLSSVLRTVSSSSVVAVRETKHPIGGLWATIEGNPTKGGVCV